LHKISFTSAERKKSVGNSDFISIFQRFQNIIVRILQTHTS